VLIYNAESHCDGMSPWRNVYRLAWVVSYLLIRWRLRFLHHRDVFRIPVFFVVMDRRCARSRRGVCERRSSLRFYMLVDAVTLSVATRSTTVKTIGADMLELRIEAIMCTAVHRCWVRRSITFKSAFRCRYPGDAHGGGDPPCASVHLGCEQGEITLMPPSRTPRGRRLSLAPLVFRSFSLSRLDFLP